VPPPGKVIAQLRDRPGIYKVGGRQDRDGLQPQYIASMSRAHEHSWNGIHLY